MPISADYNTGGQKGSRFLITWIYSSNGEGPMRRFRIVNDRDGATAEGLITSLASSHSCRIGIAQRIVVDVDVHVAVGIENPVFMLLVRFFLFLLVALLRWVLPAQPRQRVRET